MQDTQAVDTSSHPPDRKVTKQRSSQRSMLCEFAKRGENQRPHLRNNAYLTEL